MNAKIRDLSMALLTAGALGLAACASTDDATQPPADATPPADTTTAPPADSTATPPAENTTPPAEAAAPTTTP